MLFRLLVQDMIIMAVMDQVDMSCLHPAIQNVEDIRANVIHQRRFQEEKSIDLQDHQAEAHIGAELALEA